MKWKIIPSILFIAFINISAANANPSEVSAYVDKILKQFVSIASDPNLSPDNKVEKVKPLLLENLDVEWMSKFVLGRHRKGLSDGDLESFKEVYKNYILVSYSGAVKQYNGQDVKITNIQNISDTEYVVKTSISRNGQDPLLINYLVRTYPGNVYKVFDVVTEGVSMITSQQSEFTNTIATSGIDVLKKDLIYKTNKPQPVENKSASK